MSLDILTDPNPELRTVSAPVAEERFGTPELKAFGAQMIEAMIDDNGIGLAAPQVGVHDRMIVVTMNNQPAVYVNPEIISRSAALFDFEEGCLSVPGVFGLVERHKKVKVRARTLEGLPVQLSLKQLNAVIFQHEIDHLDGVLFTDKVKRLTHSSTTIA